MTIYFVPNDGGRAAAGFKGRAGDCVTRAIAIATELPYRQVYDDLHKRAIHFADTSSSRAARTGKTSPRGGVFKQVYKPYLEGELGWTWVPTMQIGSGCKVHLSAAELPSGRLVVRTSRHLAAVIDGVLHDTHDCSRRGKRCVYGYWRKP